MENEDILKRYGIDLEKLKKEQIKLAKTLELEDSFDFSSISRIGAIENILVKNKIISVIIVCDKEFNILEEQYFLDTLRFPYVYGFRSYREMPSIVGVFNKLADKPDFVFIHGPGIIHPRLGLASHFSILTGVPSIGVSDSLFEEDVLDGENILKNGKIVGGVLQSKEKSKPLFISPGNNMSLKTALNLSKAMVMEPHKLPEPLHLAHKYVRNVREELKI
jgi:deoxyribonuclease V